MPDTNDQNKPEEHCPNTRRGLFGRIHNYSFDDCKLCGYKGRRSDWS